MNGNGDAFDGKDWIAAELEDALDEDYELEMSEPALSMELRKIYKSRVRWEHYTKAKEETFARTNIPEAPWFIVEGNDKKRARLNCIHHFLEQIPYEDVPQEEITLPDRVFNPDYEREVLPPELHVPSRY
jgi:hypothetical protein